MSKIFNKSKLKKFASALLIVMVLVTTSLTLAQGVQAQGFLSPSDNPDAVANATGAEGNIRILVRQIVNFFLGFLGMVAVVMIIYGGFLYVTSAGNDEKTGQAKKIILYSVIGIIIILLSFAIVSTVLTAGTGTAPA